MTQPCSPHLYNALSYRQRFAAGFVAVLFASALTACGGGGSGSSGGGGSSYKGKSDPTDITQENSEALGEAAIQGSGAAIDENGPALPGGVPAGVKVAAAKVTLSDEQRDWLTALHQQVIERAGGMTDMSSAANFKVSGECGGNAVVSFSGQNSNTFTVRYNNFCSGDASGNSTVNGTAIFYSSDNGNVTRFQRSEERRVGKECRSRWWP